MWAVTRTGYRLPAAVIALGSGLTLVAEFLLVEFAYSPVVALVGALAMGGGSFALAYRLLRRRRATQSPRTE